MAAISSNADGKWIADAATTWVGGVAPTEGDRATILNTHDVEIDGNITVGDDTATAAITVNSGGRLFVPSTVAASYTLTCKGDFKTDGTGGTIEFGTVANPIPSNRTFNVKLNYSAALADGKYGLLIKAGGTFTCQGSNPWTSGLTDPDRCLLNANAAANDTAITVNGSTGWNANDRIAIAPTNRTYTEYDPDSTNAGQVNSVAGTIINLKNFGGTGGGLKYAHSGTSPTQAEVVNLTRNVVIENYDGGPGAPGNVAFVVFETTATVDVDWTEFRYLGTNAADKYGIVVKTTSGSLDMARCSVHDTEYGSIITSGATANNFSISNSVFFNVATTGYSAIYVSGTSGTSWTINNNWSIRNTYVSMYVEAVVGGTFTNNRCSGTGTRTFQFINPKGVTISGNQGHSCGTEGMHLTNPYLQTISNTKIWRCNGSGMFVFGGGPLLVIDTIELFGNNGESIKATNVNGLKLISATSNGDSSFSTTQGLLIYGIIIDFDIINSSFSVATGIKTAHTYDILSSTFAYYVQRLRLMNTVLSAATKVSGFISTSVGQTSFIGATKLDGISGLAGEYRWTPNGTIATDTSYYHTASPSAKHTPNNATYKLESGPFYAPAVLNQTATVSVWVRKSNAYNGAQLRLMVRRNDALGITADTQIAVTAGGNDVDTPPGTFTQLSGNPGVLGDGVGVFEFFVDGSGTAGYFNVDDFSVSYA